jgi:hypothetical protein
MGAQLRCLDGHAAEVLGWVRCTCNVENILDVKKHSWVLEQHMHVVYCAACSVVDEQAVRKATLSHGADMVPTWCRRVAFDRRAGAKKKVA